MTENNQEESGTRAEVRVRKPFRIVGHPNGLSIQRAKAKITIT